MGSSRFHTKRLFRMGVRRNQFDFWFRQRKLRRGQRGRIDDDLKLLETTYSDYQQNLASLNKQTQSRSPASVSEMKPIGTQDKDQAIVDKFLADYDNDPSAEFEFTADEFIGEAVGESQGISTFSFDLSPED